MSDRGFTIRAARSDDAEEIVRIVRTGFEVELLQAFIYGCQDVVHYVRKQIETTELGGDTLFVVAEDARGVGGCLELRRSVRQLCLNYVAVAPEVRARRLGTRLLRHAIDLTALPAHEEMFLDVFDSNTVARRWYEALGFQLRATAEWWSLPLEPRVGEGPALLSGYPHACAGAERYGFGQLRIATSMAEYTVGLLGAHWFRIATSSSLRDGALLGLLHRLDGRRRLLAIIGAGELPAELSSAARLLVRSFRLATPLRPLSDRLHRDG